MKVIGEQDVYLDIEKKVARQPILEFAIFQALYPVRFAVTDGKGEAAVLNNSSIIILIMCLYGRSLRGRCKISRMLFADDLVLLASSESGLQHAINGFAAACGIAE